VQTEHGIPASAGRSGQNDVAQLRNEAPQVAFPAIVKNNGSRWQDGLVGWVEPLRNPSAAIDGFRIAREEHQGVYARLRGLCRKRPDGLNPSYEKSSAWPRPLAIREFQFPE
jgi:hypothetical protein